MRSETIINTRTSSFARLTQNQRRWLLLGMLGLLHLLLLEGIASGVGRTLLVGHIGLFILWQPFVRAEQRLSPLQLAVTAVIVAAAAYWAGNWTMIFWTMALAGIVGGKVFFYAGRGTKVFYLLVLSYLISVLLVVLVPQVLPGNFMPPGEFLFLAKYVLPALFLVMAFLPMEQEAEGEAEVVDFVYSAFIFLLLAVLVLGSIAAMLLLNRGYFESLVATIIAFGAILLLMAWAWNPRLGFAGFGVFFSRYMLSLGLPFERWLHELADNMQREEEPDRFLAQSLEGMTRLPWVNGCEWRASGSSGGSGRQEGQRSEFGHGLLTLAIFTQQPLSPALNWHFNLLAQLLGEFYEAKLRARELQQLSFVKAIHQTGARLTHDVKNLLQSLNALCLAAAGEGDTPSPEYQALLRRHVHGLLVGRGKHIHRRALGHLLQQGTRRAKVQQHLAAGAGGFVTLGNVLEGIGQAGGGGYRDFTRHGGTGKARQKTGGEAAFQGCESHGAGLQSVKSERSIRLVITMVLLLGTAFDAAQYFHAKPPGPLGSSPRKRPRKYQSNRHLALYP